MSGSTSIGGLAYLATSVSCALALFTITGCQPDAKGPTSDRATETTPVVSQIPLRVWIVAPLSEPDLLRRQWLANSEQPLELRSLTVSEFLGQPRSQCDVLVYPAGLMGEMVQRGWIVKAPSNISTQSARAAEDGQSTSHSTIGRVQATYGGQELGLSLGCAVTTFVGSSSFAQDDGAMTWERLLEQLKVEVNDAPDFDLAEAQVDAEALVDRFFAVAATLSHRDPSYGLLFELQTMQARLTAPEYLQAAGILAALASQPDGLAAVVGSHSTAWTWATTRGSPAVAISAPSLLDREAAAIATGSVIKLNEPSSSDLDEDSENVTAGLQSERPRVQWWSSGSGLVASLSSHCRQSNQANLFLGWLQAPATRNVLTTLLPGVEAPGPSTGRDALSWKATQDLGQAVTIKELSLEPRIPSALDYRQVLSRELQLFLSGDKSSLQALQDAERSWDTITQQVGSSQRRNYEQSLNL